MATLPHISVVGMGNLGTSFAHWIAHNTSVVGWAHSESVCAEINEQHTNHKYLDNFGLHSELRATNDLAEAVRGAKIVLLSIPSCFLDSVAQELSKILDDDALLINTAKGMYVAEGIPMYDHLTSLMAGRLEMIQLAGPLVANEFARGSKTRGIFTRPHSVSREVLSGIFHNTPMEVKFTTDIQGVIWGSLLKNIYAVGWGIIEVLASDNMNLKGIYITRAFAEMLQIARNEGGFSDTLYDLAGLGDFIATSLSAHSHNRRYGTLLGAGHVGEKRFEDLPEGYFSLQGLEKRYSTGLQQYPILMCIYEIVFNEKDPAALIQMIPE